MTLSRREFLRLAGLVAASAAYSACSGPAPLRALLYDGLAGGPEPLAGWLPPRETTFAALNRLTFGPRVQERRHAHIVGLGGWIEEQLAPESIDDSSLGWRLRRFDTLSLSANELYERGNKLFESLDKTGVIGELRQATLIRQVYSRRQLCELMVEFWSDHFSLSVDKGDCWFLKTVDDRDVIRPRALGRFRDLLWASAHSPAMLVYLDNQVNQARAPNENYAREVMELHTLGVGGGYTQRDVMELARCLTGWTVKEHFWRGDFTFKAEIHDQGVKQVLGMVIEPGGQREAEQVLEALAAHPSTGRFIATKLARRFVADDPPAGLVEKGAAAFARTEGDIRAVLRTILLDGLPSAQPKFKRPVNLVASSLRMLNAQTDGGEALQDFLSRMGQPYFAWPTPDGYPDRASPWQGNLIPRWQFALALARNEIEGTTFDLPPLLETAGARTPAQIVDQLSSLLLGAPIAPGARDDLLSSLAGEGAEEDSLPQIIAAGLIAAPGFQWR